MLVVAIARKAMVIALDTPVTDQPVSPVMAPRKTGKENIAPIATQPSTPPAVTMIHRYERVMRLPEPALCFDL